MLLTKTFRLVSFPNCLLTDHRSHEEGRVGGGEEKNRIGDSDHQNVFLAHIVQEGLVEALVVCVCVYVCLCVCVHGRNNVCLGTAGGVELSLLNVYSGFAIGL